MNGAPRVVSAADEMPLLWVLRDDLNLTGTKFGCGMTVCGSCTVVVGKQAVRACATSLKDVEGKSVTTIEGLMQNDKLHPIQDAFVKHAALQCGYCTPGMIMAAVSLIEEHGALSEDEVRKGLEGNLCRCTGYQNIVDAVVRAADELAAARA